MAHARRQIREAIAAVVTGLASTGSRVFQSRMRAQEALPCLLVVTHDEQIERTGLGDELERQVDVEITGVAKAAANVDDALDAIAEEVETAIGPNNALGGLVRATELRSLKTELDDELEQPVGLIRLAYRCTYFTPAGAPGTPL